jgi:hypothetical protein
MPDPTDPVKKTKRGKTVTTTATRRGTNERGMEGTYTDTTNTTPVTTDTQGGNGGSNEFKSAFADASAQGKDTFNFKGGSYTTKKGDSNTSNETSTTSTFKRDMLKPLPEVNASGIKFSKQSYEMGKTQDIQRPGADAMHSLSVGRNSPKGGTRDFHRVRPMGDGSPGYFQGGQAMTQDMRLMTLDQKESLINNVNLHNKLLNDRWGAENITKTIQSRQEPTNDPRILKRREQHLQTQIAKGQTLIEGNKAWYKTPK